MKRKVKLNTFLCGAVMFTTVLFVTFLFLASCEQPPGSIPEIQENPETNDEDNLVYPDGEIFISSSADMAKIGVDPAYPLTGTYLLTSDVTLENWTPIGDAAKPFYGVFNGNEKTVTLESFADTAAAEKNYLGVFGYVKGTSSRKAEIKDLTIHSSVNASTEAEKQTIGLLAGYVELSEIVDITLSGTFTFDSSKTILLGGIAGYINRTGTIIKNCNSSMTMNITPGNGSPLLSGNQLFSYIGGFVGVFDKGAGIENCHNTGNVTADSDVAASQVFVGGIAGGSLSEINTTYKGYIQDCSFTGNIIGRAKGFWTWVGGIAAVITGGDINNYANTTRIERCFVKNAIVSVEGTSSGYPYVGGVTAYNYYGALVSQCYFENGTVIADKAGPCGGIVGYNSQTSGTGMSRVENCWSSGTVKGFKGAGGIVAESQINTYTRNCYSIAEVEATNTTGTGTGTNGGGVGGIVGQLASTAVDACTGCAALNPSITATAGNFIHRITGSTAGTRANNYALPALLPETGGTYTSMIGLTEPDGEDIPNEYLFDGKPIQTFYQNVLGWDFISVWKMGNDGYPKLWWQ